MATFAQLPGTLNIAVTRGDTVNVDIEFDISIVGYTISASLVSVVTGVVIGPLTVNVTSASSGLVTLSMTPSYTAGLAVGTYLWDFSWQEPGGDIRKVISGFVEVRDR